MEDAGPGLLSIVRRVAARASQITGVNLTEIESELAPEHLPEGGWLVHFTGPSLQVREAVEQAISEMQR
jgi:hypothetical protein